MFSLFFSVFFFCVVCVGSLSHFSSFCASGHDVRDSRHLWPLVGGCGETRMEWVSWLVGELGCDDGMDGTDGM